MADTNPGRLRLLDALERLLWTFVSAAVGSFVATPLTVSIVEGATDATIDLSAVQAALLSAVAAGFIAVMNAVLILARWRLSVLPDPGRGAPGLTFPPPPPATPD